MPILSKPHHQYTEEDVEYVRKYFGVDEKTVKQSVEILKNWLKQQQHLPQVADDDFLEGMLLRNKFRIERTKQKLDNYYTLRGFYPEYILEDYNVLVPSKEVSQFLPLPKLTKLKERIVYVYKIDKDIDQTDTTRFFCLSNALLELNLRNDYNSGERFIIDFKNVRYKDMQPWTITKIVHLYRLYEKVYSNRVLSIDIINASSYVITVVNLLKSVLPEKIYSRLHVHEDLESLYESVPKECLPADLGGDLGTIKELTSDLDQVFMEHYEFLNQVTKQRSNEALRIGELRKDEMFGLEGNFKQLDID